MNTDAGSRNARPTRGAGNRRAGGGSGGGSSGRRGGGVSRLSLIALGVAAFMAAGIVSYIAFRTPAEDCAKPRALIGGPFRLTDQNGMVRTAASFEGRFMLVYFGYTYCPDFCPTSLQAISETLELLGADRRKVRAIFITIDPERDTVARLKQYHVAFHQDIVMLTGSPEAVRQAAKAYRIYYAKQKPRPDGNYSMDHSTYTYLMDRRGCYLRHFRHNEAPKKMAAALRKVF